MALITEDGTGMTTAESYISVADALTHLSAIGDTTWASATTATKEAALRRATQYLDTQYRWLGVPLTNTQRLEWPRVLVVDGRSYDWPVRQVREAFAELALRALAQDLHSDAGQTIKSEQVGPLRTEYEPGLSGSQTRFVGVDLMLAKLTRGGRSALTIERAS